ncbi:hypothetical protein ACIA8O_00850 [Kitasatospora sp. NPDC051853]|uniref:hypothetical protein n=1 Tax=Kitasatospora sp. NPDC051853 TaxID=3364058 RepID=UPI003789FE3F
MDDGPHHEMTWHPVGGGAEVTLVIETPAGVCIRRIPDALPLPPDTDPGTGAEIATHTAAAAWGLPDFVFHPSIAEKKSGRRELGDRLVLAGSRGAVVQVKCRTVAPKADDGERKWINKNISKGMRQAKGTVRTLRLAPADLANGRGRTMTVSGDTFEWIAVVVVDHPLVPDDTTPTWEPTGMPSIALTRRDWDFLFNQLRSTTAVLDYLFRAATDPGITLGGEPLRYYELAADDAEAESATIDTDLVGDGGTHWSAPRLPQAPAGWDDTRAHLMTRIMLEDIATSPLPAGASEADRHLLLSDLDALPVSARTEWGQLLLQMLDEVQDVEEGSRMWRFRRMLDPDGKQQLITGCSTRSDRLAREAFRSYVQLRHHEVSERTGRTTGTSTFGVLLTPLADGEHPWDTTCLRISGPSDLDPDELARYQTLWNRQPAPDARS